MELNIQKCAPFISSAPFILRSHLIREWQLITTDLFLLHYIIRNQLCTVLTAVFLCQINCLDVKLGVAHQNEAEHIFHFGLPNHLHRLCEFYSWLKSVFFYPFFEYKKSVQNFTVF